MSLCTKEDVKIYIFGSSANATFDSLFDQLISQVDKMIETSTGIITDADYVPVTAEIIDSTGKDEQSVTFRPLRTVTQIETRNSSFGWDVYTAEDVANFELDDYIFHSQFIINGKSDRSIRINYTAGYKTSEVPADLTLLATLLVVGLYNQRQSVGFKTMNVLGFSVAMSETDHFQVTEILNKYSKVYAI